MNLQSSLTASVYLWQHLGAKTSRQVKIHSVFPNGFNLLAKDLPALIFVTKHPQSVAAHGMVIDPQVFDRLSLVLQAGQNVRIHSDGWTFYTRPEPITVTWQDLELEDLKLPQMKSNLTGIDLLNQKLADHHIFPDSGFAKDEGLDQLRSAYLSKALRTEEEARIWAESLIGRGPGLTPSGDDFLQGMLVMEWFLDAGISLASLVSKALLNRSTTDIAQSYYQCVLDHQGNGTWIRLLQAIQSQDGDVMDLMIPIIKRYGHTSGCDILLGMQTYSQVWLDN
ncbi:DUF2877 domain-containing protein [Hutsoniella sourekii]